MILLALLIAFTAQAKDFTLGVFSDVNAEECQPKYPANSLRAFARLLETPALNHIIAPGDMVHGECPAYHGTKPYKEVVAEMWAEFDKQYIEKAAPLFPVIAPGNHDAPFVKATSKATFRAENEGFKKFWTENQARLPVEPLEGGNYPYYWAYKMDGILFMVLESTRDHTLSNEAGQKAWLKDLLASEAAQSSRFKIAYGHIPPYAVLDPSVGNKYKSIIEKEQVGSPGALTDLLLDAGVDLLLVGHSHSAYPAELTRKSDGKKMAIVSMPCTHAPRRLFSKKELSSRGFAVVKITESGQFSVVFKEWERGEVIPYSYFPEKIPVNKAVSYERLPESQYK